MIDQLMTVIHAAVPAIATMLALYGGIWIKRVFDQKKRNAVNEIDLSFKKINLENQSKPIDDLVAESNKSHGADAVVEDAGDQSKKK